MLNNGEEIQTQGCLEDLIIFPCKKLEESNDVVVRAFAKYIKLSSTKLVVLAVFC